MEYSGNNTDYDDLSKPVGKSISKSSIKNKYKDRGFAMEHTMFDMKWRLYKYYRDEATLRKAYRSISSDIYIFRMRFPDGRIIPRRYK